MSTKTESAKEVRKHLESLKAFLSAGSNAIGEADTRAAFIDPLLKALGYESIADIQREAYVKDTKEFLDYVLFIDGKARIGVEAKALKKNLTDADAGQVIQYCSILGIEWAVVTNGREWRLYHQFAKTDLAGKLLYNLDLAGWNTPDQFESLFEQLWLASKSAFAGSDGPLAWLRAQQLDAALRDALTNDLSPEVKYLRKRLADKHVRASDQDVAAWFKGKLLEPPPASTSGSEEPVIAEPTVSYVVPPLDTPLVAGAAAGVNHWLVPAGPRPGGITGEQSLQHWLSKDMWGFWESTPGRKSIQAGDRIAFYASDRTVRAVIAHATAAGPANLLVTPAEWPEPVPQDKPVYKQPLTGVTWLDQRRKLTDLAYRARLDAFKKADPAKPWGWFVVTTRKVSADDFERLIGARND